MKKVKFITCIYDNLFGTELGGRIGRGGHYRNSLLSILKMTDADFVCYTSEREKPDLEFFFYETYKIDRSKLVIKSFDIQNTVLKDIISKYKNIDSVKKGDRCVEIQYMKFIWFLMEDMSYDYYYWIDAGLSHCGLIPSKYLSKTGEHNRGYFESTLFNNHLLNNLIKKSKDKFLIVSKDNQRNFWSGTVNNHHYYNYDSSRHIIGGIFGGEKSILISIVTLFIENLIKITDSDKMLYHEEHIMSLMYQNFKSKFETLEFDTWWHEDEKISGVDMLEHTKNNKSFYKILEELNDII